ALSFQLFLSRRSRIVCFFFYSFQFSVSSFQFKRISNLRFEILDNGKKPGRGSGLLLCRLETCTVLRTRAIFGAMKNRMPITFLGWLICGLLLSSAVHSQSNIPKPTSKMV